MAVILCYSSMKTAWKRLGIFSIEYWGTMLAHEYDPNT